MAIENGLYLSSKLPFGKYKNDLTFYDIIKKDLSYAEWVIGIFDYPIDPRVRLLIKDMKLEKPKITKSLGNKSK